MYHLTIAQVLRVNTEDHFISFRITSADSEVGYVDTQDYQWQFVMPMSPSIGRAVPTTGKKVRPFRIKDEHAINSSSGLIYYPKEGDIVLIAVYQSQMSGTNLTYQPIDKPVLILGQIATSQPRANKHDLIFLDQSGAKIHFNHGWLDSKNLIGVGEDAISPLTGHLTMVANRYVELTGRKFLPFGLYSHHLQKGMSLNDVGNNPEVVFESEYLENQKSAKWNVLFTRNIGTNLDYTGIYDPNLIGGKKPLGEDKFLDVAPPEPEEDMKMHDSGWKRLIREDGSEQRYYTHRTELVGKGFKQLAFTPDNLEADGSAPVDSGFDSSQRTILHTHSQVAGVQRYYTDQTSVTVERKNIRDFGLHEKVIDGEAIIIPTTLPTTPSEADDETTSFPAESGKYKIKVGTVTIVVDPAATNYIEINVGAGKKVKITGDLVVTGNVQAASGDFP